mmetsp:Transcript_29864/g.44147  ORF Transcript_29864/g.44147 Transcript_29864/m.44147 type:complete len:412 (-) Transcript_29864:1173-2408(-)|eukprot:CAMPEP_0194223116 /NCGR_PEP_ID=MMETSP0156-20130528/34360_1 /TAXON_ID=33649 /ORGANISM="Thalassionema nitzschioides, Strain L26-B" /LENGTH=411 /DNA_ID=CAMNT_0038954143 /DNA_START=55 /DNA_END=1290 /DNA_ORIENTATION=+
MSTATPISSISSQYPPGPILMLCEIIDLMWGIIFLNHFADWRSLVPAISWFDPRFKLPPVFEYFPDLTSYGDYVNGNNAGYFDFSTLYSFAFETESTKLGDVTSPASMVIIVVLVLILRAIKSILLPFFSSIGRRVGQYTHGTEWEKKNEIRIIKFGEYVFRLLYHLLISAYGIYYFSDKPWWNEQEGGTKNVFLMFPNDPIAPGMSWYYLIQCAYNVDAMLSLLILSFEIKWPFAIRWRQTVRGDFREMFVHHLVTNALIMASSRYRLCRIGSMVFMVHDISDIPVDMSKLANFLKWKMATAICFLVMVIFWVVFRLSVLPFVIYRAVIFESHLVLENNIDPKLWLAYRALFILLLGAIILLHAAWFLMFVKMGYYLIFKGETHDFSEHKKGENVSTDNDKAAAAGKKHQ